MLTQDLLTSLYQSSREREVLSLYVDAAEGDPAERRAWRTRLDQKLAECREGVSASGGDVDAFDAARDHLLGELQGFSNFLPGPGWVGFARSDGVVYADLIPVPMPTLAVWERGLRVAPYVRALKQDRPVVVALADRFRARVFTYLQGRVEETDEFQASSDEEGGEEAGRRSGERSGTRGNATDQANHQIEIRAERMLGDVVGRVRDLVGEEGLVVVGGTRETGAHLMGMLPDPLRERATVVPSLHLEMTPAQVKEHAETAATELTRRVQSEIAARVIDRAKSGGRGVLEDEGTAKALLERRVDLLVLTRTFIAEAGDRADHMVGTAFEQGSEVEEISGEGAERLDEEGGGVGALLRW
jgi:hypothetical protein